ncbi:helix-turn-helix domain-containing protein [Luteibacter yeojuensis]|uniref:HTH cro/C1-type domain-containing protein n=1 Tax=Luteibacter yeojuensis TaxID=345309 RepID=A0A0F3KWP3_9GAMM|nr:helix-turn-helix transcriptional regulator [Luteibacter yeojuensis]KJV35685.1 hypothetical protein VI08_06670 [Luteibacter yeojuensis]
MLSPFGKLLRKMRIDRDKTLADLAGLANVSTAFVSAVETGRKAVPPSFIDAVTRGLSLTASEESSLAQAAAGQAKEVTISLANGSDRARELAVAFARRFENLSEGEVESLFKQIAPPRGDKDA